jgi:hypothetical protein
MVAISVGQGQPELTASYCLVLPLRLRQTAGT